MWRAARARGDVKRWPVPYVPIQASDLDGDYRGLQAVDSTALTRHDGEVAGVTPRQLAAELLPNLIPGAIDPTCSLSNVTVEVVEAKLSLRALLAIGFVRSLAKADVRVRRG